MWKYTNFENDINHNIESVIFISYCLLLNNSVCKGSQKKASCISENCFCVRTTDGAEDLYFLDALPDPRVKVLFYFI